MLFHTTVNIVPFSSSANVLVFGDFRVHFKGWINYSGGTDRPVELCCIFSFSNDISQIVNFATWLSGFGSHNLALLVLFLPSDPSMCPKLVFFNREILTMSLP